MTLNTDHPAFDLVMELLLFLPVEPHYVHAGDITRDLGLESQQELTSLLKEAHRRGFRLLTTRRLGRLVALQRIGSAKTIRTCDDYWKVVCDA